MPRTDNSNEGRRDYTTDEETAKDAEEETWNADEVERNRPTKYEAANAEYVRRGIVLMGIKARGSLPEQALTAAAMKETQRGGPNADALADLHDKLDTLKDLIEAATNQSDLDNIDITDDIHWA